LNWDNVLYFYKKYAAEFYRSNVDEELLKSGSFPAYQYKDYQIERNYWEDLIFRILKSALYVDMSSRETNMNCLRFSV
jgi:hypothetical protein